MQTFTVEYEGWVADGETETQTLDMGCLTADVFERRFEEGDFLYPSAVRALEELPRNAVKAGARKVRLRVTVSAEVIDLGQTEKPFVEPR